MKDYKVTIGLEIHAELKTDSKMFCDCVNNPDEEQPNTNICPVCMAHPGTLPVLNKKAIENVIKVGLAINGNIANFTEWDRKNYFYPDIPKGYQISQYKYPIVSGGELAGVKITRIHLEEDTAKSNHNVKIKFEKTKKDFFDNLSKGLNPGGGEVEEWSGVDFNRAGVPLMELVTEPVIHSAEDAGNFGRELQLLLRTLGVSDANMEKGEMRVELNLSISDTDKFGTKVEVKNINSFRAVEKAAEYEIKRHVALLEEGRGNEIVQETRGWDENKEVTFSQRSKENSEDYRYFPEPDLPKMHLHEVFNLESMRAELPDLPWQIRESIGATGPSGPGVDILVKDKHLRELYFSVTGPDGPGDLDDLQKRKNILAFNYITSDMSGLRATKDNFRMPEVSSFVSLIKMVGENKLNSRGAKDILAILCESGGDPEVIAKEKGLLQESNTEAIKELVKKIIDANPKIVEEYKAGNENLLKFLMGQVMKESKGSANPQVATEILVDLLN